MEDDDMFDAPRAAHEEPGAADGKTATSWMRRQLSDSIYLWACGEKADDEEDNLKLSDRLIGWIILFGFAYAMLIFLARATSSSNTSSSAEENDESGYLLPSVTGAMYLLVASTAHDLRAGFSLMVDGERAGHRFFGIGLLIVYGIMICAAMTVLVSTSSDSASVVLNAVTVVFIADLDEKAVKVLSTVPQKWRLFWVIESFGMSFTLAVVAIFYIGDSSSLLEGNNSAIQFLPTWFVWGINPVAVTLCSYVLSSFLQDVCDYSSEGYQDLSKPTSRVTMKKTFVDIVETTKTAKKRLLGEPFFYVGLSIWLAQVVPNIYELWENDTFALAFDFVPTTASANESFRLVITNRKMILLCMNAVLVIGLAMTAWCVFFQQKEIVATVPEQPDSSERKKPKCWWGSCADSRVPTLLVGWGIGYWVMSFLYVLLRSWHGGGWNNAPVLVTIMGYVILPCFSIVCVFMVCDINFLGTSFGAFVKPAVNRLKNRRRAEYWIMATVFRDVLVVWIGFCDSLKSELVY